MMMMIEEDVYNHLESILQGLLLTYHYTEVILQQWHKDSRLNCLQLLSLAVQHQRRRAKEL
jgi:hypothetical protein